MAVVNEQCHSAKQDAGREGKNSNSFAEVKADKRSTHTD